MPGGDGFPVPPGTVVSGTREAGRGYENEYAARMGDSYHWSTLSSSDGRPRFVQLTAASDNTHRYIRIDFIESLSAHQSGTIIKTFSGDFHVVKGTPGSIRKKIDEALK